MKDRFVNTDVLRQHAESMYDEGWYTIADNLTKAADEIEFHRRYLLNKLAEAAKGND